MVPAKEHPVLDTDRTELARPDSDERKLRGRLVSAREPALSRLAADASARSWLADRHLSALPFAPPEQAGRREQELLPGLRADVVAEQRGVVALTEPVAAAVL